MTPDRFLAIAGRYAALRVAVVGDFFLDRYFEIDPSLAEISIETGLPVHNVANVRAQPGAAGTILNNLAALGIGTIVPVGFCGDDGEGYELRKALAERPGVRLDHFLVRGDRRTPVYGKPLIIEPGRPPRELSRLDAKNRTPTPAELSEELARRVTAIAREVDAILLMDQVDLADTGVVTPPVRSAASDALGRGDVALAMADSRRGLADYPPLAFKMNAAELARMVGESATLVDRETIARHAGELARRRGHPVYVSMAEGGILGLDADGSMAFAPAHPVRGPIDVVGAGDAVTANLVAALAAGATTGEALTLAMAAASLVIHQLGTTGTASIAEIARLLGADAETTS